MKAVLLSILSACILIHSAIPAYALDAKADARKIPLNLQKAKALQAVWEIENIREQIADRRSETILIGIGMLAAGAISLPLLQRSNFVQFSAGVAVGTVGVGGGMYLATLKENDEKVLLLKLSEAHAKLNAVLDAYQDLPNTP